MMKVRTRVVGERASPWAKTSQNRRVPGDWHTAQCQDAVGEPLPLPLSETPLRGDRQLTNPRRRHSRLDDGNTVVADEGQFGAIEGLQDRLVTLPGQGRDRAEGRPAQEGTGQTREILRQFTGGIEGYRPSNR